LTTPEAFDYEGTVDKIHKLQKQNIDKVRALANAGRAIDPGALANIKIDTFIESFLTKEAQASYVLAMETNVQSALNQALAQLRSEQLTQGTPASTTGGLILPR
jgi:hypothetical protein